MKRASTASIAIFFVLLLLAVLHNYWSNQQNKLPPNTQIIGPGGVKQTEFVFCHWNVENLFDDRDDNRTGPGDREYDELYATRPDLLKQKLAKLTEAILKLNGGKGPDLLALVEVESTRAAELLQQALNEKLTDKSLHYTNVLMKEIAVGRHIAPVILTRLPVVRDRTRSLDKQRRILVGHVVVNDQELVVIASHWTSRLNDGTKGRTDYADKIYGLCNAMHRSNPDVDFLVCGDFNDGPDDESVVRYLNSTGDQASVRAGSPLRLFNLFAGKDPTEYGTHFYRQWHIFDQILVSPGMLDQKGWTCDPASTQVYKELVRPKDKNKRPWRFGGEKETDRGYSDHFPVLVKLRVEKGTELADRR
jgi:endonuclease/exonuclease/phosphatase family metal-dependent hydrolase